MIRWLRNWFAPRPDPLALFAANRSALLDAFLRTGRDSGRPRGLRWLAAVESGEPVFARDPAGALLALLPATVNFEPVEGSDMEAVPQATGPRPVVAVFAFDGRAWHPTGKAVFNLSATDAVRAVGLTPEPRPG